MGLTGSMRSWSVFSTLSLLVSGAVARAPSLPLPEPLPLAEEKSGSVYEASFQQLIDHNNPDLGTFAQRYWYNDEWWKGKGAPVSRLRHRATNAIDETGCSIYTRRDRGRSVRIVSDREHNNGAVCEGNWWRGDPA